MIVRILILVSFLWIGCKGEKKEVKTLDDPSPQSSIVEKKMPMDTVDKALLLGRFSPKDHDSFVVVDRKYGDRAGHLLQKECYDAFVDMAEAAKKDGITLTIRSATRNHDYQKGIWERKWTGQTKLSDGTDCRHIKEPHERALRILEYSSMPGSSRHHWGTDLDLNSFNNRYFESGEGLRVYNWLKANAASYGFCQPYDDKSTGRTGYNEEKWHWSYMPLSKKYTMAASQQLTDSDLKGFLGAETAQEIGVVKNYILGIRNCGTD